MPEAVRRPAVAGSFYPEDSGELRSAVDAYLAGAAAAPGSGENAPKALIAPHAGYVYSGPVAASGYAWLAPLRGTTRRVVLLGPAHRVALRGIAAPRAGRFATPLGEVVVDRGAMQRIQALPQVVMDDLPHTPEHSLEVHLPFLQRLLGDFSLVPLLVGDAAPEEVAEVLDALWGGDETLIVVSSDLSHYYDYATAQLMDAATTRAIEALRPGDIESEQACGRIPVQGLLLTLERRGLGARAVDVRNSGDTAGSRDAVVGYGSYVCG